MTNGATAIPEPLPIVEGFGPIEKSSIQARQDKLALRIAVVALVLGAFVVVAPFGPWLMLAAWFSAMARPALLKLARAMRGRNRAAALLTLGLFVAVLGPVVALIAAISLDALDLWRSMSTAGSGDGALRALVARRGAGALGLDATTLAELARTNAERALGLVSGLAGFAADAALGLFVFFSASYVFLTEGPRAFDWLERNTPVANRHIERLTAAFQETGRGLLVSVGLSGLVQALLATVTYVALDVPRAAVLGFLTLFASLIPSVGTALVWVPVSIGLGMTGRTTEAIILVLIGVFVVSTSDNLMRPLFARWGKLDMHTLLVLVSMLGGLALMGAWGLLIGPVIVRLAIEALRIAREERALP